MSIFKKKEIFKVKSIPVDPTTMGEPTSTADYLKRGTAYYARKNFSAAEADLNRCTASDPTFYEAHYRLGMVLKALGKNDEAVKSFQKVVDLIAQDSGMTKAKSDILRRLALGHINELTQGDWNLEKEIWQHIE